MVKRDRSTFTLAIVLCELWVESGTLGLSIYPRMSLARSALSTTLRSSVDAMRYRARILF